MEKYKVRRPKETDMIFGVHAVLEALQAGKVLDKVLLRRDMTSSVGREIEAQLPEGTYIQKVPVEKLNQYTDKPHQGVIAFLSPITFQSLSEIVQQTFERGETPLFILLDGITDVRNFGAITRTALCVGTNALVLPTRNSVTINGDAIKASAGALMKIPICREEDFVKTIEYLKASGIQVLASTEHTTKAYTQVDMTLPTAIVMGSEGYGIYPENLQHCSDQVRIPIIGELESLNVSVAAGVLLYEVIRQRMKI